MIFKDLKNKFILGTVQFGKAYGISNLKKKPISLNEKDRIFKYCKKIVLRHLDSAEDYNFKFKPKNKKFWIIDTKISSENQKNLKKIIQEKYKDFILDTVYIRNPEKLLNKSGAKLFESLLELKKKKFFKKIGVSVYDIRSLNKLISIYKIDVVQLPYNIIDRRFEKIFYKLKKKKILIYARSIFLQGLLLDDTNIKFKKNSLKNFHKFAQNQQLSLCLNFVKKNKFVDKYVIGIQNLKNLEQILNTKIKSKLSYPKYLASGDKKLIDPRLWKN